MLRQRVTCPSCKQKLFVHFNSYETCSGTPENPHNPTYLGLTITRVVVVDTNKDAVEDVLYVAKQKLQRTMARRTP